MTPDQNVYCSLTSKPKSKARSRPVAPAIRRASSGLTGIWKRSTTMIARSATTISTICFTSAHATACTPPNMV